ncbi:peptidase M52 [Mycobacterium intermedium]|uniref:Peptidase M52 n=1 Tax=Mycobacterium intermedium TaxID=28445 RepID=A0A1E3SC25_MYCIE|nr:hydrogenase maturation protease [Mycobacterium intermedium]MCV6966727.1 hydrogenase maturation protease [Mycobacterium intermedium]ODQ99202.1 peptidase M52 [Mycobacterium intermedium]OPE51384.1 peptidase M52 [Mycobacterium intermedium]ORB10632.1 peptidase M52 [Mycobacterium intermedium]
MTTVVIGLGNPYRRDDGVGIAAAVALKEALGGALKAVAPNDVQVLTDVTDPMSLVEHWSGARLALVIDAAVATPATAGRIRRCALSDIAASPGLSSHTVDIVGAHALAQALGRAPDALVVFTVDVVDTGHGPGLTQPVAAAVPEVVRTAVEEITRTVASPG